MGKQLKINIKNVQLAKAVNLAGTKESSEEGKESARPAIDIEQKAGVIATSTESRDEAPKIKARTKSAFAEPASTAVEMPKVEPSQAPLKEEAPPSHEAEQPRPKSAEELRRQIFGEGEEKSTPPPAEPLPEPKAKEKVEDKVVAAPPAPQPVAAAVSPRPAPPDRSMGERREPRRGGRPPYEKPPERRVPSLERPLASYSAPPRRPDERPRPPRPPYEKLGPTGKHIKDLLPPPRPRAAPRPAPSGPGGRRPGDERGERPRERGQPAAMAMGRVAPPKEGEKERRRPPQKPRPTFTPEGEGGEAGRRGKAKVKEFRDVKASPRKGTENRAFDVRDRHGLRADEEGAWRRRRQKAGKQYQEDTTIRPTELKVRLPITVKDLAAEMKLKASQLIAKLFMQGIAATINDPLDDEVVLQLLGEEFGCAIAVDRSEEERIRITGKTIREEIAESRAEALTTRAPVVAFMGHVDHGKTSLIDAIRQSNRVAGEAGAITQHIGAFCCSTAVGNITVLDTPGHEAFSAMRARGADVTDIVVLVVAGDEGIRQQTIEAINHAKAAGVTIVVAINKCDRPNFNAETVYRQLSEQELLPEAWGGQTITVNCSAITGEGIKQLLEMLALQAEVLELKADPTSRARGSVLESELHKGLGPIATVLVQNGTLHLGDAVVFGEHWGRIKTMRNEFAQNLDAAGPSTPVEIAGLSGLPEAGQEFIVVKNEKEARDIAEARSQGLRQNRMQLRKVVTADNLFQQAEKSAKKTLNVILRADVQGSLEALKTALLKIHSDKIELNILATGVGEISESDVLLAESSHAAILGFHTQIESHAEALTKQHGVAVYLHDIIYHAIDQVKELMKNLLDKIPVEEERGVTEIKAVFKSSQYGFIAGCQVSEGSIHRNHLVRIRRGKELVWKGTILSLKREKEDVREVQKGMECGVLLNNNPEIQVGDLIESYEITYHIQEL